MSHQILQLLGALLLLATFQAIASRGLAGYIGAFVEQSVVLSMLAAVVAYETSTPDLYLVTAATLLVKVGVIPRVLRRVAAELPADDGVRSLVGPSASIVISLVLMALAFLATPDAPAGSGVLNEPPLSISVGMVLIGMFLVSTRRHVVAQLVGLLTVENGLFAGALAVAYGLPFIVEFGVLFDVFVTVVVVGLLVALIGRELASADTTELRRLRG